jgi:hypothetical protein
MHKLEILDPADAVVDSIEVTPLKVGLRNTNHKGASMLLLTLKILLAIATPVAIISIVVIVAAFEQHYLDRKEALKCPTK